MKSVVLVQCRSSATWCWFEVLKDDVGVQQRGAVRSRAVIQCPQPISFSSVLQLPRLHTPATPGSNCRWRYLIEESHTLDSLTSLSAVDFVFVPQFTFSISLLKSRLFYFLNKGHTYTHTHTHLIQFLLKHSSFLCGFTVFLTPSLEVAGWFKV